MTEPVDVTALLNQAREGDSAARESILQIVYDELRRIAGSAMQRERAGHTLQPTALVHEAYLRLFDQDSDWESRQHFLALAATMMRRVLGDYARRRRAAKRGGKGEKVPLSVAPEPGGEEARDPIDLLALDEALTRLSELSERQERIVTMRYLTGMTIDDVAAVLEVSRSTVEAEWRAARAWLRRELGGGRR